jgi:HAD superfamily hydrolase (TIGR01490 family)
VPQTPKNPNRKIEAAFFDVDNTILRGSSSFLFGKAAFRKGFFTRKDFWRMAWQQAQFIRKGEKNNLNVIKDRALSIIAGHRATDLTDLTDEVYENYISPKLWPETVRLAKEHIAAGREVWLVTATPKEIADVIAHRLGLTGGLGTIVEVGADGIITGKLVGDTLHGKAKRKAVKQLAKERGISLKRSFAYSDSVNDLPMLTSVGNPVVVNPDVALRYYANEAAWPILDFKKRELRANKKSS